MFWAFSIVRILVAEIGCVPEEKGIFRLHLFSAVPLALVAFALVMSGAIETQWPVVLGALSVHGIYSVSFLELWSLSQGGYSLSIVERAAEAPVCATAKACVAQRNRRRETGQPLGGIALFAANRGWVPGIVLTPAGRLCYFFFRAIALGGKSAIPGLTSIADRPWTNRQSVTSMPPKVTACLFGFWVFDRRPWSAHVVMSHRFIAEEHS